jgi:hypothetical protein
MMPFMSGTSNQAPEQVWAALWAQLQPSAKVTLDLFTQMLTIFSANPEIALLIQAAAPNGTVGTAAMSKEQAAAIAKLGSALGIFMQTPIEDGGFTPAQIIHRLWPAPVMPPPAPPDPTP